MAANCGGGPGGPPIILGGIPPACMNIGFPATTGAPWTLDMTGAPAAAPAAIMPAGGTPLPPAVVAAAEIVAGLGADPLLGVMF